MLRQLCAAMQQCGPLYLYCLSGVGEPLADHHDFDLRGKLHSKYVLDNRVHRVLSRTGTGAALCVHICNKTSLDSITKTY